MGNFNPDDIVSIDCDSGYDPPRIIIRLSQGYPLTRDDIVVPKPFYDWLRGPLGLPDVVCG